VQAQQMSIVTEAAGLRAGSPSAIIACEGADFLEGQPDRVDEACTKWSLRHLQLTHYRVNELGDIQTEPPVHGATDALAVGMARMVDAVGVDHVGLGTDMRGLVGPSVFPDYDRLPALAEVSDAGFSAADAAKILGGNYLRVLEACMVPPRL
jgi:microsomal dipeptidase-like Zn-dependent dipeptidase